MPRVESRSGDQRKGEIAAATEGAPQHPWHPAKRESGKNRNMKKLSIQKKHPRGACLPAVGFALTIQLATLPAMGGDEFTVDNLTFCEEPLTMILGGM